MAGFAIVEIVSFDDVGRAGPAFGAGVVFREPTFAFQASVAWSPVIGGLGRGPIFPAQVTGFH